MSKQIDSKGYDLFYRLYNKEFAKLIQNSTPNLAFQDLDDMACDSKKYFHSLEKVKKLNN